MSRNLVIRGVARELSYELGASEAVRLGRSRRCDLIVEDPTVSRIHAEIRMEPEQVVLHDLKSTNGTFVNDVRARLEVVVPGDRIRLGSAELEMCLNPGSVEVGFETPQGEKKETRTNDILVGVAENLSPVDLVQVLAHQGKSGTLMLHSGRFGRIDFIDGRVCFAKVDGVEGEKAFHRILGWGGAEFQFRNGHPKQVNVEHAVERLLVDNMRLQEEYQALLETLPDLRSELTLVPPTSNVELSAIEEEVVRVTGESKALIELMDAIPHLDVEVARAVSRLLELEVLLPNPACLS